MYSVISLISELLGFLVGRIFRMLFDAVAANPSRDLADRFERLGDLAGRTEQEIVAIVGPPSHRTGDSRASQLSWRRRDIVVSLIFVDGQCHSISDYQTNF